LLPYFSKVCTLEPSEGASTALKKKSVGEPRMKILKEMVGVNSIPVGSLDFAMSLGVLYHTPDTRLAIKDVGLKIKSVGFFLLFVYKLDNKSIYYCRYFGQLTQCVG